MRTSLAATAAAAALILSACGTEAPVVTTPDPIEDGATATTAQAEPSTPAVEDEDPTAEPTASVSDEADESEASDEGDEGAPGELALGERAEVGDYSVAVTEVQLDADDVMQEANEFNDPPSGQYVLLTLDVTYTGAEEGDPWLDLAAELAGSDARNYDESTCGSVAPNSAMDVPTLATGGKATYNVCFDVPVEALEDPRIYVEESFSFDDTRAAWDPSRVADPASTGDAEDAAPARPDLPDALELGTDAQIGDYSVAVTEVQLDANDVIAQTNEFNDEPSGQYVLVTLDVTYTGDDEGDPWLDLSLELAGSDARNYDSSSCWATTPNSVMDLPTLATGGQAEFDVCFDVPADAVADPYIYVEESFSLSDTRVVWRAQ